MFEKVVKMLSEYLEVDPSSITKDTDIKEDLKADSLVVVEMMFNLEEEFGITIEDDMVEKLSKVGTLVDYLEKNAK